MTRKLDPRDAAQGPRPGPAGPGEARLVPVPRAWFVTLAVLIVVPWLVAAAIYAWRGPRIQEASPLPPASGPTQAAVPGPWGRLSITPITISPPLEYVASDWGRRGAAGGEWLFPDTSVESLDAFLRSTGLSAEGIARLRATARAEPQIRGMIVSPDAGLVRSLAPEVRARLYGQLATSQLNFDQANSFRFYGDSVDAWLAGSLISPAMRALLEPLIYRDGDFLHFADSQWIRAQVGDPEELRRMAKVLLRQRTVLVRLRIDDASEVERLAEYWGRGGRRTDLRPLLESVAGTGEDRSIDIIHLLPAFARDHLYRYPRITTGDLDKGLLANCLWSALNFFAVVPDDRFTDVNAALTSLRNDYYVVQTDAQLGDVVAFLDEDGDLFHVAVHVADGLVFSKNGTSPMAPWAFQTVDQLKGYYRARSANPRLIYHRRNGF